MDLWSFCILNLHDEVILINLANMVLESLAAKTVRIELG